MRKRVAISIGDLNGIGLELALKNHCEISKYIEPIYLVNREMALQGAELLDIELKESFTTVEKIEGSFQIRAGELSRESGDYSFRSFRYGVDMVSNDSADALLTLPVNKEAWSLAGIEYLGHTDALRDICKRDAIMMMGVPEMYVALFTEHTPLSKVPEQLTEERLYNFLLSLSSEVPNLDQVGVLGLNPHAGDGGVLGDEDKIIEKVVDRLNGEFEKDIFSKPLVPDVAFTPKMRSVYRYYVAIYHDQGLAPLKALYFDEVINISLNLPIKRVSVGHGTAFDTAYKKGRQLNSKSYLNSVKYILGER
jgi:4-hydroxythreonine-4-phosphate dehydrogenase